MRIFAKIFCLAGAVTLAVMPAFAQQPAAKAVKQKPIPSATEIEAAVSKYFDTVSGYQKGDLITQEDVEPLLKSLQEQGLPLPDAKDILKKVPTKSEFLVQQMNTPNGRRMLRRIASLSTGIDRLDRLSRLPQGHQTVRMLVNDLHGERMIEYLTNTKGGTELGKMLSKDPGGANFNAPTGRIYTASQLLEALKKSREQSIKAAEKDGKK